MRPGRRQNRVEIWLNGERREVAEGSTVEALISMLEMEGDRVAVELNRAIVRRAAWGERVLTAGAKVEVVHFVGGG
jgi:sulfur carrier protein